MAGFWYLGCHGEKHGYMWEYEIDGVLFQSKTLAEAFKRIEEAR